MYQDFDDDYYMKEIRENNEFIYEMEKYIDYNGNLSGKSTEENDYVEQQIPEMGENNKFNMIVTYYDDLSNEKESIVVYNEENVNTSSMKFEKTTCEKTFNENLLSDQNLRRKCKHMTIDSTFDLVNKKISESYKNKIGKGICKKQLIALNQKQKSSANTDFNKEFLNKTIGEIFSDKISSKYSNFLPDHNKKLIQSLLNNEDENNRNYFTKLFNFTFLQCLEHYRGTKFYPELKEMKTFTDDIKELKEEDYIKSLEYYLKNYEIIIQNKKPRKSKKSQRKIMT